MSIATTGLLVSATIVVLLSLLFSHEEKRGVRYGESLRIRFDFLVLQVSHTMHNGFRFLGSGFLRQAFHYVFHSILRAVLKLIKKFEDSIRNIMYTNRTIAKSAEKEHATRSMLEEVALHKLETTLSEEEKKRRKAEVLEG